MDNNLSKRITAIIAAVCILATSCSLCGCYRDRDRYYNYIVEYMNEIQPICTEYKLVDGEASGYEGKYIGGGPDKVSAIIVYNDIEMNVNAERTSNFEWELSIEDEIITIDKAFMAARSKEYIAVTEMWFKYNDDMENYRDKYNYNLVTIFDNNIFILAYGNGANGMMGIDLYGYKPVTLYKYDLDKGEVLYVDYYIDMVHTRPSVRIVKEESN